MAKNKQEDIKHLKEQSFVNVRLLLKGELVNVLWLKEMLIGTNIYYHGLDNDYILMTARNDDNSHYEKIRNNTFKKREMDLEEAHEFALEKVKELMDGGIQVTMTAPELAKDKKAIAEAKERRAIPSEKWIRISFQNLDEIECLKIFEAGNYLGLCGISFDCGGFDKGRDWELDWSFEHRHGEERTEWIEAREVMEDNINSRNKPN